MTLYSPMQFSWPIEMIKQPGVSLAVGVLSRSETLARYLMGQWQKQHRKFSHNCLEPTKGIAAPISASVLHYKGKTA